ncbi:hypothetical protein ACF0H5_013570 [Mactra antiquata]
MCGHPSIFFQLLENAALGQNLVILRELNDLMIRPEVTLNTHRMSQFLGKETILECKVSASPHALITWTRNGQPIPYARSKYRDELYGVEGSTEKTLALQIIDLEEHDFGYYTCTASNPLGEDSETMYLYELEPPRPPPKLFTRPWQPSPRPTVQRPAYYPDHFITSPIYAGSRHSNRVVKIMYRNTRPYWLQCIHIGS